MKLIGKFRAAHDQLVDCVEAISTYGLDTLNETERMYANKLAELANEYLELHEEESAYAPDDDE
jgi:hypothetical protein